LDCSAIEERGGEEEKEEEKYWSTQVILVETDQAL
jgi:hypothetical protein